MKRSAFFLFVFSFFIFACNVKNKNSNETITEPRVKTITVPVLLGSYVGDFGNNKIRLLISKVSGDSIEGRSVVAGNDRPFNGTLMMENGICRIMAKEPGDDKHDGVFNFTMDSKAPDVITGEWRSNDTSVQIKSYTLQRRTFMYLQDVGSYPEASQRALTEDDVNNLSKEELEFMRNEIFARHGYCFKKRSLRELFELQDWYIPNSVDVKDQLTETEKKNILLIKKYEKYAEEYGDDFGR